MSEPIVYFIHAPKADLIKIGVTTNLKRRLTAHQGKRPGDRMKVLHTTPGWTDLEGSLHHLFGDLNVPFPWERAGVEWFRNDPRIHDVMGKLTDVNFRWSIASPWLRTMIALVTQQARYLANQQWRDEDEVLVELFTSYHGEVAPTIPIQDRLAFARNALATDDPVLYEVVPDLKAFIDRDQKRILDQWQARRA